MSGSGSPRDKLRNSKRGVAAMSMPADSGAMLVCKVAAKRPMPCIVIAIHGVNDDGQFFPVLDRHICEGLKKRLGRDDFFPHKWETWTPEGKVPVLDHKSESTPACVTRIAEEGRSPLIPFHWGYRPVDHQTYRQDQQRYLSQLRVHNSSPDLPYSTYYRERRAETQNRDNLNNWLDGAFAKEGGTFANATTNLVDMWGPGPNGGMYGIAAKLKTAFGDSSSPMHPNPHRIYYVHAAQRLADLIIRIRAETNIGLDAINIIAHSQGTEIAILANFIVAESKLRPADCVIMCNSPYGLDPTAAELALPGKHPSRDARVQTLANFVRVMHENRNQVSAKRIVTIGVANKNAWDNPDHSRDNFGHVYNYFCPQDSVVSLPNIQGIGWQGVDNSAKQTISAAGPNFFQRVFSDGPTVGEGPETFKLGGGRRPLRACSHSVTRTEQSMARGCRSHIPSIPSRTNRRTQTVSASISRVLRWHRKG